MFREFHPSFDRYRLVYTESVSMNDVNPFMTDAKSVSEAIQSYLSVKESQWLQENPKPNQVRLIQSWFMKKLTELHPDYQFLVDGVEVSTEEALRLGVFTWNIELQMMYDDELSKALEKEKENEGR